MPAKNRVGITAQLTPGVDDDLIAWRESLPDQGRNQSVKAMLRAAIGLPQNGDDLPDQDTDDLRAIVEAQAAEIEQLRGMLANVPRLIESAVSARLAQHTAPAAAGVEPSALSDLRQAVNDSFEVVTGHINDLYSQLDAMNARIAAAGVLPAESMTSAEIETTPRLDDQELAQRANKLKKASW